MSRLFRTFDTFAVPRLRNRRVAWHPLHADKRFGDFPRVIYEQLHRRAERSILQKYDLGRDPGPRGFERQNLQSRLMSVEGRDGCRENYKFPTLIHGQTLSLETS